MSFVRPTSDGNLLTSVAGQAPQLVGMPIPPPGPSNTTTDPNAQAKLPKPATPAAGVPLPQLGSTSGPAKQTLGGTS